MVLVWCRGDAGGVAVVRVPVVQDNFCKWRDNVVESKPDDFALPTNPKAHCSARLVQPLGSPVPDRDSSRRASMPTLQMNPRDTLLTRFAGVSTRHVAYGGGYGVGGVGMGGAGLPPHHVPPVHPNGGSALRLVHPSPSLMPGAAGTHRQPYAPGLPSLDSSASLKSSPQSQRSGLLASPAGSIDSVGSGRLVPNAMGSFGGGAASGAYPLSARPGYGRMPSTVDEDQPGDLEQGDGPETRGDGAAAASGGADGVTAVAVGAGVGQQLKVFDVSSRDDLGASQQSVYQTPRLDDPLGATADSSLAPGASASTGDFDAITGTTGLSVPDPDVELALLRSAVESELTSAAAQK